MMQAAMSSDNFEGGLSNQEILRKDSEQVEPEYPSFL